MMVATGKLEDKFKKKVPLKEYISVNIYVYTNHLRPTDIKTQSYSFEVKVFLSSYCMAISIPSLLDMHEINVNIFNRNRH